LCLFFSNDHGIVFNYFQMIKVLEVCSGLFAVDLVIPESLETRSQSSRPTNLKKEFGKMKKKIIIQTQIRQLSFYVRLQVEGQ
jgi:hypothetical protein